MCHSSLLYLDASSFLCYSTKATTGIQKEKWIELRNENFMSFHRSSFCVHCSFLEDDDVVDSLLSLLTFTLLVCFVVVMLLHHLSFLPRCVVACLGNYAATFNVGKYHK